MSSRWKRLNMQPFYTSSKRGYFKAERGSFNEFNARSMGLGFLPLQSQELNEQVAQIAEGVALKPTGKVLGVLYKDNPGVRGRLIEASQWHSSRGYKRTKPRRDYRRD